ncbi:MAG: sulfatase-like hydrolase/transferase [bacterium]
MADRVNFLYFITDQHRADYLGCYGHPRLKTPHIDSIAEGGTRFDRFYVASPVCMPNRATLMTGRMTSVHGVRHNGLPLPSTANTFVDVLRAAGYDTALIGKSHLQNFTGRASLLGPNPAGEGALANAVRDEAHYDLESPEFWEKFRGPDFPTPFYGFNHVDLVTEHGDANGGHYAEWLREKAPEAASLTGAENQLPHEMVCPQAVRTALPEDLYSTSYIRDRAKQYIQRAAAAENPFFAFVSFPDPHHPFNPPGRYWDLYRPNDMQLPPSFDAHKNPPPPLRAIKEQFEAGTAVRNSQSAFAVTGQEAREAMALTCGMIAMVDDAVGSILELLRSTGLAENTVVIFNADHGDYMGDHGIMLKGPLHFQGMVRVPFLWNDPMQKSAPVSDHLTGTVDVARTVLARAGATPYTGMQGIDLATALTQGSPQRDAILIEDDGSRGNFGFDPPHRVRTLITGHARLSIYLDQGWGELYDLKNDPHELENLWDAPQSRPLREELMEKMAQELMRVVDRSPWPVSSA